MQKYDILITFVGVFFSQIVSVYCYKLISANSNFKYNIKTILILVCTSLISIANNYYNAIAIRAILNFLILLLIFEILFRENIREVSLKTIIIFLLICTFEILLSIILFSFPNNNFLEFDQNHLLKSMFSSLIILFVWLVFEINNSNKTISKIINYTLLKKEKIVNVIILIIFLTIVGIGLRATYNFSYLYYLINVVLFLVFIMLFGIFISQYLRYKRSEEKEEILLNFMSKYEKMIDRDRVNRHEILNNLLILKSFENRNSKKFEYTLNTIIKEYQTEYSESFSNIYNLPSGLKGLIYYKIYDMRNLGIIVILNISNKVLNLLDNLDIKELLKIYKILGILLDNAREAAETIKNKKVIIDIYNKNDAVIVYIENTCKKTVKINFIGEKNYSTKGPGRGIGLYIAYKIVKNNSNLNLEQFINSSNNFVSVLSVKK